MSRVLFLYSVLLIFFAFYLAYLQHTWASVVVVGFSFMAFALLIANHLKVRKDV